MDRDSLGHVALPAKSSENSTRLPALNVRVLGPEYERQTDVEQISRLLYRLAAAIGEPFGRDEAMMKQMAREWAAALADLPAVTVERAVDSWIKTESRWPKPAEIRRLAEAKLDDRVSVVASANRLHERRVKPVEAMSGFLYSESRLRRNPLWAKFLDAIHPSAEHAFFRNADMREYAHELTGLSLFDRDYIREHWGEQLNALFGCKVSYGVDHKPDVAEREDYRLSAEEIARRVANCLRWRQEANFPGGDAP